MVLHSLLTGNQTLISNRFIDEYMPAANGEYVKVYLYLLRLQGDTAGDLSVGFLADRLDNTEKDIMRALRYWEKLSLLSLDFDGSRQLQGITLLAGREPLPGAVGQATKEDGAVPRSSTEVSVSAQVQPDGETLIKKGSKSESEASAQAAKEKDTNRPPARHTYKAEELQRISGNEDFAQLLFLAEKYLGKTLSARDVSLFAYMFEELGFPVDLIEYLIEYCVDNGHPSLRYMERVALNWHSEGKRTLQAAKEAVRSYTKENRCVMKAFGIHNRVLTKDERAFISRWLGEFGMPIELVEEACRRTISAIHDPSFAYAEKIIARWHECDAHTPEAVRALDGRKPAATVETAGAKTRAAGGRDKTGPSFNFDQRKTDYDALLYNVRRDDGAPDQ